MSRAFFEELCSIKETTSRRRPQTRILVLSCFLAHLMTSSMRQWRGVVDCGARMAFHFHFISFYLFQFHGYSRQHDGYALSSMYTSTVSTHVNVKVVSYADGMTWRWTSFHGWMVDCYKVQQILKMISVSPRCAGMMIARDQVVILVA